MATQAPATIKEEKELQLWDQMADLYESYCGSDPECFPEQTSSFLNLLDIFRAEIAEAHMRFKNEVSLSEKRKVD